METRPDPDELLRQIGREEKQEQCTGRLKIFFGYAAGVGKTYAMLKAAHSAKESGVDVVAGYVEPHMRPETGALLTGLEQLPLRETKHKGIVLRDFDLDAALSRKPQLILVDELAHTNPEGSRHEKRFQDVKELLHNGIDVYTTVNVQHLESLYDLVASITGVAVRERVPDRIFDEAFQVELVDIEPEELLKRLKAGKIYQNVQAHRAMEHFFTVRNLAALREIALRRTADRVDHVYQKESGKSASGISEHILICLSAAPSNPKVIRTAARLREAFHGRFTALYVTSEHANDTDPDTEQKLKEHVRLAEQLGARVVTLYGEDIPRQIAEYARVSGITKIVLGRTVRRFGAFFSGKSLVERLSELAPDMDIYIIPDTGAGQPRPHGKFKQSNDERINPKRAGMAALLFGITTVLSLLSRAAGLNDAFVLMLYVSGILMTAMVTGNRLVCLITAVVSVLTYDFFFIEPYLTWQVSDPGYGMAFLLMLILALFAGTMARRIRRQAGIQAENARRTEILLGASQNFQHIVDEQEFMTALGRQLVELVKRSIIIYPAGSALGSPMFFQAKEDSRDADFYLTADERGVAAWVMKNNKHAGATTGTLPGAKCLYLAARSRKHVQAVVGISLADGGTLDAFDRNLLLTLLDMFSMAFERTHLSVRE